MYCDGVEIILEFCKVFWKSVGSTFNDSKYPSDFYFCVIEYLIKLKQCIMSLMRRYFQFDIRSVFMPDVFIFSLDAHF